MIQVYQKGTNVKLSSNFNSVEFDCHCDFVSCEITYIDSDLIKFLQNKRDLWNLSVIISSGFRCARHNQAIGGKSGSYHLIGKAADIKIPGLDPSLVADDCEDFHGLGRYKTFTHVDVRGYKARWRG